MNHYRIISAMAALIACTLPASAAYGQTAGGTTAAPEAGVTPVGTVTSATPTATSSTAVITATSASEARYVARIQARYPTLATQGNLESLVHGLRTGTEVTLTSPRTSTPGTASTSFTPPTRPMGYGNISRAMTLASAQLAAAGINDPTPQQLQTALMGGNLTTATGNVNMQGVLQLRSEGMGWGQISHQIGVQPGMGAATSAGAGTTAAAGAAITTAAGGNGSLKAGTRNTEVRGRGIVTAAGTGAASVRHSSPSHGSSHAVSAGNAAAGQGIVRGTGQSAAGIRGHGGKQ